METHDDFDIDIFKTILYCGFIPKMIPTLVYSVTDWTEFQYPVKYFITASLKQIGLGYMVPISDWEKSLTLFIMLAGLYFYGWRFNGIISAMVMSREDEQLGRENQLNIVRSFCAVEQLPPEAFEEMKLSAALMWSSHDLFRNTPILERFYIKESKKLMVETVQKTLDQNLRLFRNLSLDIRLMFAYQFSGFMIG